MLTYESGHSGIDALETTRDDDFGGYLMSVTEH